MKNVVGAVVVSMLLVAPMSTESAGMDSTADLQITKMLERWQSRLELGRWHIAVRIVAPGSLGAGEDGTATLAEIIYDVTKSSAEIRVAKAAPAEIEESLVHELMHLKLAAWQPPARSDDEEQTVDTIAYALLGSKSAE
jgi:hypothetical protein